VFDVNQKHYVTKAVHELIPLELQQFLWPIIDCRKAAGDQLDYLQVFELRPDQEYQLVHNKQEHPLVHNKQEHPPLQLEYKFRLNSKELINSKVWMMGNTQLCFYHRIIDKI